MHDNELYIAMREGRVPLRVDLEESNGTWTASYDQFGIQVSVTDDSSSFAQNEVIRQVLDKARNHEFTVKVG